MSLEDRLKAEIRLDGPMNVARYMALCLHDPEGGYYTTRPALGADGDFITAPLVSQMFGELIGLWCAEVWTRLGWPKRFAWVEMGPGDGTLIADAIRAARALPGFLEAAELWLVEPSEPLRGLQAERLMEGPLQPHFTDSLAQLPRGAPIIMVANELLDCLPARQFVMTPSGWAERMVGLDENGALAFGLIPAAGETLPDGAPPGAVLEVSTRQAVLGAEVGVLLDRQGGAALLIDYGRARPEFGDTLQALRRHEKVSPLQSPGEADLTVHADFPSVLAAARRVGVQTSPILTQRGFLMRLGIETRAAALSRAAPDKADLIARQLDRLIAPDQMGELFKAAAIHAPGLVPPGFEED